MRLLSFRGGSFEGFDTLSKDRKWREECHRRLFLSLEATVRRDTAFNPVPALPIPQEGPMILITGATGNIGVELVKILSGTRQSVRAFVRNRSRAQAINVPGIELVQGDFARPETFMPALDGVDRLFLLIPSSAEVEQQQRNFVDAAKRSKVRHVVKLYQLAADEHASWPLSALSRCRRETHPHGRYPLHLPAS